MQTEDNIQDEIKGQEADFDNESFYGEALKKAQSEIQEEKSPKEQKGQVEEKELETQEETEELEEGQTEPEEKKQGQEKEQTILGKTEEEIEEIINKKAQEAVQKREVGLKEEYEAQTQETARKNEIKEIEQRYQQYEYAIKQIDELLSSGEITPQQYKESINQAANDMAVLKMKYQQLKQLDSQTNIPKVKRANEEYYQQLNKNMPELKDPVVAKYAQKLKNEVFDANGVTITQGGFDEYVKRFLAAAIQESRTEGYQKAKNEMQNQSAKAKAKSVIQEGDSRPKGRRLQTAEDIMNASEDDLLKFVLD